MTQMDIDAVTQDRLVRLGESLRQATHANLEAARARRNRPPRSRRVLLAAAAAVVLVPAGAIAATQLFSNDEVAASLPQGTRALIGTDPSCSVVTANVEYRCVLAKPPSEEIGGEATTSTGGSADGSGSLTAVVVGFDGKKQYVVAPNEAALKRELSSLRSVKRVIVLPEQSTATPAKRSSGGAGVSEAPEGSGWKGTVEPTVDASKHVDGGCRALSSTGTEWECYIGQAAVDQSIISRGFLGQYAPSPGVG
jgi:hypothetical protein